MTPKQFWTLLRNHDWYFAHSDDHRYWLRGTAEAEAIQQVLGKQPELTPLYQSFVDWINSAGGVDQPPCPQD